MYKDKQRYLEYQKNYYLKNKKEWIEYSRNWKAKNKKKVSESGKKWYQNHLEERKQYRLQNRDRIRANNKKFKRKYSLRHKYGITVADYEELFNKQNGVCAICASSETRTYKSKGILVESLCVDHDHKTDEVRGLLCHKCNSAIGLFMEDVNLLEKAIGYLKKN